MEYEEYSASPCAAFSLFLVISIVIINGCKICVDIMTGKILLSIIELVDQFVYLVGGEGLGKWGGR